MAPPSGPITNLDARGCSLGALDRIFDVFAARERDAHAAVLRASSAWRRCAGRPACRGAPSASASAMPVIARNCRSPRSARITAEADGPTSSIDGIGKPEDRAQVKLELVRELARSASPCRCRAGAGESSEKIAWSPRTKNSTPKMPWPPSASTTLRAWYRADCSASRGIAAGCQLSR